VGTHGHREREGGEGESVSPINPVKADRDGEKWGSEDHEKS